MKNGDITYGENFNGTIYEFSEVFFKCNSGTFQCLLIFSYFIKTYFYLVGFKIVGPEKKICHSKKNWTPEEDVVCVSAAA